MARTVEERATRYLMSIEQDLGEAAKMAEALLDLAFKEQKDALVQDAGEVVEAIKVSLRHTRSLMRDLEQTK